MNTANIRLPTYFISHGGLNAITEGELVEFWQKLGTEIKTYHPKGVIVLSGHWETAVPSITANEKPGVIDDFDEDELYQIKYGASTTPELISSVEKALLHANLLLKRDTERGFDHGTWSPLKVMLPDADIPVAQLSLFNTLNAQQHINLGKALSSLRDEGYIILGSGGAVHNLGAIRWDNTLLNLSGPEREIALANFEKVPTAKKAHPTTEHFMPLLVAAGANLDGTVSKIYQECIYGSLSLAAYKFN